MPVYLIEMPGIILSYLDDEKQYIAYTQRLEVGVLAITLGDPHSVNIELLRRLLADNAHGLMRLQKQKVVIFCGNHWQWRDQERRGGFPAFRFTSILAQGGPLPQESGIYFLDLPDLPAEVPAETLSPILRGRVATAALTASVALLENKKENDSFAVVTGPIDKHACSEAGFAFPGQTEFYSQAFGGEAVMLLAGDKLRVGLVTNHLPIAQVSSAVTKDLIVRKGMQLAETLINVFGLNRPNIAVCGLNPHAGDQGLFGREDLDVIAPAVARLNEEVGQRAVFSGPHPADTVFYRTVQGKYDAVLAMYHDQGLGPMKTLHFDDGVNISGGLKHLRVSPDHGPAKDLFLTNTASSASVAAAVDVAVRYLESSHESH